MFQEHCHPAFFERFCASRGNALDSDKAFLFLAASLTFQGVLESTNSQGCHGKHSLYQSTRNAHYDRVQLRVFPKSLA